MCQECGISSDGVLEPSVGNLEGTNIEKMKTWLVRLRQTCTHPEVGSGNKKALGGVGGPLRTVNEGW